MKDNIGCLLWLLTAVVTVALCLWLTKVIWYSDLPEWFKWLLLR